MGISGLRNTVAKVLRMISSGVVVLVWSSISKIEDDGLATSSSSFGSRAEISLSLSLSRESGIWADDWNSKLDASQWREYHAIRGIRLDSHNSGSVNPNPFEELSDRFRTPHER